LAHYIVAASDKHQILTGPTALGVERHLFPELEGLSETIVADNLL